MLTASTGGGGHRGDVVLDDGPDGLQRPREFEGPARSSTGLRAASDLTKGARSMSADTLSPAIRLSAPRPAVARARPGAWNGMSQPVDVPATGIGSDASTVAPA